MSDEKVEQAVLSILRMTHEGTLRWTSAAAPETWLRETETIYPLYFETSLNGRKLALFSCRERIPSHLRQLAEAVGSRAPEWNERYRLALLADNDGILFEFPPSPVVRDLFVAVRYKVANVDEFLDELIQSAPAEAKQ